MEASERAEEEEEEEEEVWSWGAGTEGQLGTGKLQDEHLPQLLRLHSLSASFSHISCGGAHVIALTPGKKVLTWGRGTSGQLGHGDTLNCLQPKTVQFLDMGSINITHVSAGWNHSGFVSECGFLFTCGDGSFGQLGHGDRKCQSSPLKISYFSCRHVEQIACGMRHSLALLKGNSGDQVYGFGARKRSQLGISNDKIKATSFPQITCGLEGVNVVSIFANGDHSAALSVDGHLYTWGRGFSGTSESQFPRRVIASSLFTRAAMGWNHALVLTGEGEVFMLGGSHHGVLSNPQKTNLVKQMSTNAEESNEANIKRVPGLVGMRVVDIAAGAEHSALATENGELMTWGWGEHGQLGLGNTADHTSPQVVSLKQKLAKQHTTVKVYCGSGFTYAARIRNLPSQT